MGAINPLVRSLKNKNIKKKNKENYFQKFLRVPFAKFFLNFFPHLYFYLSYLKQKIEQPKDEICSKVNDKIINQTVKNFLQNNKNSPFFAWIHYIDIHEPYFSYDWYIQPRPISYSEFIAKKLLGYPADYQFSSFLKIFVKKYLKYRIDLYDQGIKYVDKEIGELLNFLREEKIYENTIICLTADHGEEFSEHGGGFHGPKLYNELLHVPLMIKIPGKNHQIINKKVSLIDLPTTLGYLIGIKYPPSFKGKDLFENKNKFIFHQTGFNPSSKTDSLTDLKNLNQCILACQSDCWKYIINYRDKKEELYNLSQDPKEQNNLAKSELKILSQMRRKIQEFRKENPPLTLAS
jgi:arylsulfatase A-like enzyme